MKRLIFCVILPCIMVMTGCASYSGRGLQPGVSELPEITATMGEPAMRWENKDGSKQLAYPRGPAGTQTFMVFVGSDGRLQNIEGVLNDKYFAQIIAGKSDAEAVLKLLGPPPSHRITYFKARDELVWEWRICDNFSQMAFFNVLFDGTTGIVRSTLQVPDYSGFDGVVPSCGR